MTYHPGIFNGAYHLGPRRGCAVCDRRAGYSARTALHLVVLAEMVVALVVVAMGHHLSWPQFIAVGLLPWIVRVADRRGWLWGRSL